MGAIVPFFVSSSLFWSEAAETFAFCSTTLLEAFADIRQRFGSKARIMPQDGRGLRGQKGVLGGVGGKKEPETRAQ
jgi:hypothetical protein